MVKFWATVYVLSLLSLAAMVIFSAFMVGFNVGNPDPVPVPWWWVPLQAFFALVCAAISIAAVWRKPRL